MDASDYVAAGKADGSYVALNGEPGQPPWDPELRETMRATGCAVYEETVSDQLLTDLSERAGGHAGIHSSGAPAVAGCTNGTGGRARLVTGSDVLVVANADLPDDLWSLYAGSSLVAWDIETSGLDWREDRIGTCQLFAEGIGTVVVSLHGSQVPERLAALLEDPGVVKIFHHAPFDLRFMVARWGVCPTSVRCTKVASKLLDSDAPNEAHSLQHLLRSRLGVHLSKGPVRTSNWSAATLSPEQVQYAAADVMHLPLLLESLQAELAVRGLAWLYDQCCVFLPARAALEVGNYPDVFSY